MEKLSGTTNLLFMFYYKKLVEIACGYFILQCSYIFCTLKNTNNNFGTFYKRYFLKFHGFKTTISYDIATTFLKLLLAKNTKQTVKMPDFYLPNFLEKAVELHTKRGQCKKELQSTSSTTTTTTAKSAAVNTDDCFLELPSYVLEGTALGKSV